ncbi:MOSC domain containing protein [Rhodotorula toruloides]|uniref:MOSC domain containing protein n=1 Tax=Rhodotorula toruloides TaxID=5286 RepID=A0A511KLX2_RHOTO|nr:MOSC domain containing protein [Rhodotorula toruloides]
MAAVSSHEMTLALVCVGVTIWLRWKHWRSQHPRLTVEKLLLYPIKGLRPLSPDTLELGRHGFRFDRRFVLVSPGRGGSHECHLAAKYPSHALLRQSIDFGSQTLTITPPSGPSFTVALEPPTAGRPKQTVDLHRSPVEAFDMGDEAAEFFTRHSDGKETRLMYLDEKESGARKVLGRISDGKDSGIAFQDCASYMIASSASLDAFSQALGRDMPILPLRPNILVGPASKGGLKPWAEDFWSELPTFRLTANCVRCISLNIDYETGKRLEGKGLPLQTLAKDRRVDSGTYSPVFGRYAFSHDVASMSSMGFRDSKLTSPALKIPRVLKSAGLAPHTSSASYVSDPSFASSPHHCLADTPLPTNFD